MIFDRGGERAAVWGNGQRHDRGGVTRERDARLLLARFPDRDAAVLAAGDRTTVLGDSDGVIVIPAHLADEIADEAVEMTAFEDFVTEQVRGGRGILGLYPATDPQTLTDFAAWRKKNGR